MPSPLTLWPSTSDALVERIKIGAAMPPEAIERREYCNRVRAVLGNDFAHLVDESLASMFTKENYALLKLFPHTSTNVMLRVLSDVCRAYQEPATRYLKGVSPEAQRRTAAGRLGELLSMDDAALSALLETPAEPAPEEPASLEPGAPPAPSGGPVAEAFERLLAALDLDSVMAQAQVFASVMPVVWLFPVVRVLASGKVGLDIDFYTPYSANVKPRKDDRTQAESFYTWAQEEDPRQKPTADGARSSRLVYYEWTATTIRKYDADWRPIVDGDPVVGDGVNHLGRLPVVAVRLGRPIDSYFLDGLGGDLYDGTIEVAVLRTLQNARFRDSAFKQLVIDGDPAALPPEQIMGGPSHPIFVDDGSASILDFQPQFDQQSAVVKERIIDLAATYGVSPASWTMSERVQSGFSKKMDSAKVLSRNREQRKWLASAEADLFRLVATGVKTGVFKVPELAALDPAAEYVVDFADPRFEEEPKAQAEADARDIEVGKTSILDIVLRDNPDLTEEEGLALLARNRLINERFAGTGSMEKGATILELLAEGGAKAAPPGAGPPGGAPPPGGQGP